jgi:hypothetical protein
VPNSAKPSPRRKHEIHEIRESTDTCQPASTPFQALMNGIRLALVNAHPDHSFRFGEEAIVIVLRVCGRMQIEFVNTIKELIEMENTKAVLDLSEFTCAGHLSRAFEIFQQV